MFGSLLALTLMAAGCCLAETQTKSKSQVCANVFCGAGRECTVTEKGEPTCLCIEQCKPHKRSVCGSNGKTYRNHCELHRDACLTGLKVQVAHDGSCAAKKADKAVANPIACYVADRNRLRNHIVEWLQAEIVPDGWFTKGSNFTDILIKYFKVGLGDVIRSLCYVPSVRKTGRYHGDVTLVTAAYCIVVKQRVTANPAGTSSPPALCLNTAPMLLSHLKSIFSVTGWSNSSPAGSAHSPTH